MANGIALSIGLNFVDPNHYAGWDGKLNAPEFDANDMFMIASKQKFNATKLIREEATLSNVANFIEDCSQNLNSGDIFLLYFSGHGGKLPDQNSDEDDGTDETWCLFDGQLVDDKLYDLLFKFDEGVRVLVISDSCNSGTVIKSIGETNQLKDGTTAKFMPDEISASTYLQNMDYYDEILTSVKNFDPKNIKASVLLISACQDNQDALDGTFNSAFTGFLKNTWNGGKFNDNYWSFKKQIASRFSSGQQSPNYFTIGIPSQSFENQKPFTV